MGKRHGEAPSGRGGPPEPAATAHPAPAAGPGRLDQGLWRCAGPGRALRVGHPLAPRRALCALDGQPAGGLLPGLAAPGATRAAPAGAAGPQAPEPPHDACAAPDAPGGRRAAVPPSSVTSPPTTDVGFIPTKVGSEATKVRK